jgi:methyltransferase
VLIALPGGPPVTRGPYRWLCHPNYPVIAAELAILPPAFDRIASALGFSAGNALLLLRRIRLEDATLGRPSYHIRETLPHRN